jgi:hypothetical protein
MVKQWVKPPPIFLKTKNRGSHLTSFIFYFYYSGQVFIGILGENFEIQFLAICHVDFQKGFNQI